MSFQSLKSIIQKQQKQQQSNMNQSNQPDQSDQPDNQIAALNKYIHADQPKQIDPDLKNELEKKLNKLSNYLEKKIPENNLYELLQFLADNPQLSSILMPGDVQKMVRILREVNYPAAIKTKDKNSQRATTRKIKENKVLDDVDSLPGFEL